MQHGLNRRQHRFALGIVAGLPQVTAYKRAGYAAEPSNSAHVQASRLVRHPKVQAIVTTKLDELRARAGDRVNLTRDTVLRDLEAAKHLAVDQGDAGPAIRATELQGRAIGMFHERGELTIRRGADEDLIRAIAAGDPQLEQALRTQLLADSAPSKTETNT